MNLEHQKHDIDTDTLHRKSAKKKENLKDGGREDASG